MIAIAVIKAITAAYTHRVCRALTPNTKLASRRRKAIAHDQADSRARRALASFHTFAQHQSSDATRAPRPAPREFRSHALPAAPPTRPSLRGNPHQRQPQRQGMRKSSQQNQRPPALASRFHHDLLHGSARLRPATPNPRQGSCAPYCRAHRSCVAARVNNDVAPTQGTESIRRCSTPESRPNCFTSPTTPMMVGILRRRSPHGRNILFAHRTSFSRLIAPRRGLH